MTLSASPPLERIVALLCQVPWFTALDDSLREWLAASSEFHALAGGEVLFFEGEAADSLYLLVSGALIASRRDDTGVARSVGQIVAGETVGELGVLITRPRSATVRALRDCELIRLPAHLIDALGERQPRALLELARLALRRSGQPRRYDTAPRTIALLPASRGVGLDGLAEHLSRELRRFGPVMVLRQQDCGRDVGYYHSVEQQSRFVLYVADGDNDDWRDQCRRQADAVIHVVRATAARGEAHPVPPRADQRTWLVMQHESRPELGAAAAWKALYPEAEIQHVRDRRDIGRIARTIAGQSLALVLSGGGARGFAHIGVVRALREAGLSIDRVGGTSIGAVIGAGVAADWDHEELVARFRRGFHDSSPLADWTLPLVSLLSGRKLSRILLDIFGERCFEDLALPFFSVSANLTRGDLECQLSGSVWRALRASVAIPGLIPPVFRDGDVLVDGGVVNNFPVDVMRQRHRGEVIGVELGSDYGVRAFGEEYELPSAWRIWRDSRAGKRRPGLREILLRAAMLNSAAQTGAAREQCSLLIQPDLRDVGLLDWRDFDRIVDRGYQHTLRKIGGRKDALADELPLL